MGSVRLIARLDVKAPNLIKGIRLEGLRKIGDPNEFAQRYYDQGADEILYMDVVASLYNRNSLLDIVERTTKDVFVPITVGGGIRSTDDVAAALKSGADKVAINTAAVRRPELISDVARIFGSQCMVLSIEAKQRTDGDWEVYTDNGREHAGKDVISWARQGVELGAGEVLVTSVDREGTFQGFDLPLVRAVADAVSVPVIASGGMGNHEDCAAAIEQGRVNAVAVAGCIHYGKTTIGDIRAHLKAQGISVRSV